MNAVLRFKCNYRNLGRPHRSAMNPKGRNGIGERTRLAAVIGTLVLMSGILVVAQQRSKPVPTSSMRALALLEVTADGRARLVPIALKVGDKFYDASLYRASPRPLALDSGVVYQAERAGDPVGLFTVTQAQKTKDVWVGLGQWRPGSPQEPERKVAEVQVPPEKDERPVLKRHQSTASQPAPSPTATPTPSASAAPSPSAAAAASPSPSPTPAEAKPAPSSASRSSSVDEDPSRPILRRGKPAARQDSDELAPSLDAKPGASRSTPRIASAGAALAGATASPAGALEVLTAISDAAGPKPHSFVMELTPEEHAKYESSLRQTAFDAVVKFAASHPPHKPASIDRLEDPHFAVYDVHDNNEPDMIFTAALPERLPPGASSAFRYFVTLVARVDIYGEMRQLLASVTDSSHLDAYARLELVDVADADGSGSGQMLFRRVSDDGYDYVLYRVGSDKLWPLFEGAGSETK